MNTPETLKPGDKCFLIDRDFSVQIVEVEEVEGRDSHWIKFVGPIRSVFCTNDNKTFVKVYPGKKLFFDKERVLTYLNEKVKKIQRDIRKIEKI